MGHFVPMPDMPRAARHRLPEQVGDLRQLALVQRITLSDGPDAGQKLIAFSTGGGLDFQLKEEGSLDICSLHLRGLPVGWRHPAGDTGNPQRALTGFLVTCGLENVRAPRDGLPQHGSLALSPVRVTELAAEWDAKEPQLVMAGEITRPMPCGAVLRLTRRITAPIGGRELSIEDRVQNVSATPAEMMILYHVNFGFPVVAPGCSVHLGEDRIACIDEVGPAALPGDPRCHPVGAGTPVILERPAEGCWPGMRMRLTTDAGALPFLQVWRDARAGRNILALEPCNCDLRPDGTSAPGTRLAPGESWQSRLGLAFD
ncbi:DUF4432 family protein [Marinovum sp.]|uniref:DUF4432 family protein n=1 Tax=Marinovum sp. TaxID=2024839 RepID=UPI003A9031B7